MDRGERSLASSARVVIAPTLLLLALALWQHLAGRPYRASAAVAVAVGVACTSLLVLHRNVRWLVPAVAPMLAAGALGILISNRAAVLPAAAGCVLAVLLAAGVDVAPAMDRAVGWFTTGLRALLGAASFGILILPAWVVSRLRRLDPLRARDHRGGWATVTSAPSAERLGSAVPQTTGGRTLAGTMTWGIGVLSVLLITNYGVGWAWDQAFPTSEAAAPTGPTGVEGAVPRDPRNDVPAMAAYPWREEYFDAIQRTPGSYWPFTESRPLDYSSRYVNLRGWERQTYAADRPAEDMPTIWMFGGSTTWGEGQRDDYTVASWLGRLSEEDGLPVRMVNYGQRGWTHFQEMVLYEQLLAAGPTPEVAVFYDGANEITSQSLVTEAVPTHTLVYAYAQKLTGSTIATQFVQASTAEASVGEAWQAYTEHSALHKVAGWLRGDPAGAAPAQDAEGAPGVEGDQDSDESGLVTDYRMTEQDGIDAGQVYERGKQFTLQLSERYGVEPLLLWQPVRYLGAPQQRAAEQLTAPTIDISDALADHDDVFIDGGHTNEEGARIVAEAIWAQLRPTIETWYEEQG